MNTGFVDKLFAFLPELLAAILIFFVFWCIAHIIGRLIAHLSGNMVPQKQPVLMVLTVIVKAAILIIGAITALGSIGVHIGALVTSLGLSGFAVSFAAKDALANLMAGVLVLFYQPFGIGDTIQSGTFEGNVAKISLRYTHLKKDDKEILIPNATLLTNSIVIMRRHAH